MLAALQNIPKTEQDWSRWSFNHDQDHYEIIQAIAAQKQVSLQRVPLDPIPFFDFESWLMRNAQSHVDFNGVLGLPGNDLSSLDLKNPSEVAQWVSLNFQEHYNARAALKI